MKQADDIVVDTLDVWQERLPEFDAETISAKYRPGRRFGQADDTGRGHRLGENPRGRGDDSGLTGDRTILGKISKCGNRHLRVLFVQGA